MSWCKCVSTIFNQSSTLSIWLEGTSKLEKWSTQLKNQACDLVRLLC